MHVIIMTDKNSKKNFKAKVIAKLFGEADEDIYDQDDATSSNSTEEDSPAALVDSEIQDGPLYGVHCPLSDQTKKCIFTEITVNVASESDSNDGESENVGSRKRRRRRKGHQDSDKTHQGVKPSTCETTQITQSVSCTNDSLLPATSSCLTKNQKRKLKKKRKEKEKRAQSTPGIEFIFDSSEKTCS